MGLIPSTPFRIEQGRFGISLTDPLYTSACDAVLADFSDYSCQVTSGVINANPTTSTDDIPATWCDPAVSNTIVGATTYEAAFTFLQDPQIRLGVSRFIFEHDAEKAWIFMGLDQEIAPKAVAQVYLTAGAFGGEARVSLTTDVTFPIISKPMICYGDVLASDSVGGNFATGATAGTPGSWTPSGADVPNDLTDLQQGVPNTVIPDPATAWEIDEFVVLQDGSLATWSGTGWVLYVPPPLASVGVEGTPGTWEDGAGNPALGPETYADLSVSTITAQSNAGTTGSWAQGSFIVCRNGDRAYWNASAWVQGTAQYATGARAGTPGTWTPAGAMRPTSANLIAGNPNVVTATPTSAWTTGQFVETAEGTQNHWDGTTWVGTVAP